MTEMLTSTGLFAVVLTLGTYEVGLWLRKKTGNALCNPLLISIMLVMAVSGLLKIPAEAYGAKMDGLSWLLTPATVCLAVPLYEQVRVLKKNLPAIFAGVVAGTATSLVCVGLMSRFLALESPILASLLPKSVTTALAIAIAEQMNGIPAVSTAAVIITGIFGCVCGSGLCKLLRIDSPVAQGVAFGTASHVLGTSRAAEISELTGAVSSLSLVVAGILTAICCPVWFSLVG